MYTGVTVLHRNSLFDLDAGTKTTVTMDADLWWNVQAHDRQFLWPLFGTRMCALGNVSYDALGYVQLVTLAYGAGPVRGDPPHTELATGNVIAARTHSGRYLKIQIQNHSDEDNLEIRWQVCSPDPPPSRVLKVVVGSAPAWLVSRYVVECIYAGPDGSVIPCGRGEFAADGGVLEGSIYDTWGGFPPTVRVVIVVDFQPDTRLQAVIKEFEPEIGPSGVLLLYEPNQEIQRVNLVFSLIPRAKAEDNMLVRWAYRSGSSAFAGSQLLAGPDLQGNVAQYEIVIPPVESSSANVDLTVDGIYQGAELVQFKKTFSLPISALAFRFRKQDSGPRYRLEPF